MLDNEARRARRSRARRAAIRRRRIYLAAACGALLLLIGSAFVALAGSGGGSGSSRRPATGAATTGAKAGTTAGTTASKPKRPSILLAETPTGSLPAALQDAAAAAVGSRLIIAGGLNAADTSTSDVRRGGPKTVQTIGNLPQALHDAAAATLGTSVYYFGGGDGVAQHAEIRRIDPASGAVATVGSLPAPASDVSVAAIGGTAYVVGGYTGARWLNTIVAYTPSGGAKVVGHTPQALRYPATTAVGKLLVIAGGSTPDGSASSAVLVFDPATGQTARIGSLPTPTTHAGAATLNGIAYVIGGRGAILGSTITRITAIDPLKRRIVSGGSLASPRSDMNAVTLGDRIVLAGGSDGSNTIAAISTLAPQSGNAGGVGTAAGMKPTPKGNVYAFAGAGMLSPVVRADRQLVYVPNSASNTVDVIDPRTFKVIDHFAVGALPQHVTPSWDLKTLYVDNDMSNSLTPINPRTGKVEGPPIPVDDPYNLYFTPDGRFAIVVAERLHRLDFRDPHTMRLVHSLAVPCSGVDHMDFSADGSFALASCEFSGELLKIDMVHQRVAGTVHLNNMGMPQDVKLSPDGRIFYVADMAANGVWEIDARTLRLVHFLPTGKGAHGLYPSRNAKFLYVSNRGEGSITVVSFATRRIITKWWIPGGGSPDMGGVSADGKTLWLSGRYNGVVYAINTANGKLRARIAVGSGPHGLAVWPQPGRYSLGHTGILR